jgi:hypothetical protein
VADYPAQLLEYLDRITGKVRGMTVDRMTTTVNRSAAGLVAFTLGIAALCLLLFAIYGALAIWLRPPGAFAVLGLLCLGGGMILWTRRNKRIK